ncbi:unnamed protein product [Enterobius vermicularis]|uniref:Transmembrane protein n=1 Tax=Enterobius vermicularis TaxID=51028 RepID=A0A0N4V249_ENTVE|nr:unnamed protein product [Enterobius vermicularis]
MGCVCAFVVLLDGSAAEVKNSVISVWDLDLLALRGWSWWTPVNFDLLRGVVLKTITDEVLQYTPLSSSEDYFITSSFSFKMEPYVRGKLSFEDPEIEKNRHGVTPRMLEVYDYLTLKLDAIYNGRPRAVPRLYSKEWNVHYSKIRLDDRKRDDNDNDDADEKRSRKRMQRIERPEKQKKMKFGRDRD